MAQWIDECTLFNNHTIITRSLKNNKIKSKLKIEQKKQENCILTFSPFSLLLGERGGLTDYNLDAANHRATLPGAYDPVVERELRALGSRPTALHSDPSGQTRQALGAVGPPGTTATTVRHLGVEPLMRASHANLARPVQGSEESVSVGSDYYGSMFSLYRGRTFSMPL